VVVLAFLWYVDITVTSHCYKIFHLAVAQPTERGGHNDHTLTYMVLNISVSALVLSSVIYYEFLLKYWHSYSIFRSTSWLLFSNEYVYFGFNNFYVVFAWIRRGRSWMEERMNEWTNYILTIRYKLDVWL
jgi:hypothetical protein